ncbi:MAG: hypothetical protein LBK61_10320, partial [Spirochaetaceae bacterium]|nr:hypothetical protein [Spirochaetaceae bacterium]
VTEPVKVHWKNRRAVCEAVVLPDTDEVLLGAIPMEAMDLIVHPAKEEVTGAHGSRIVHLAK